MIDFKKITAAALFVSMMGSGTSIPAYAGGSDSESSDNEGEGSPKVLRRTAPAAQKNPDDQPPVNTMAPQPALIPQDDAIGHTTLSQISLAPQEIVPDPLTTSLQTLNLNSQLAEATKEEEELLKSLAAARAKRLAAVAQSQSHLEEETARQLKATFEEQQRAEETKKLHLALQEAQIKFQEAEQARLAAEVERIKQAALEDQKRADEAENHRLALLEAQKRIQEAEQARLAAQVAVPVSVYAVLGTIPVGGKTRDAARVERNLKQIGKDAKKFFGGKKKHKHKKDK